MSEIKFLKNIDIAHLIFKKQTIYRFISFAGVGIVGTIAHYSVLIFLVQLFMVFPILASIAGFITGALVNYILNYHFTFRSNKKHKEAILKFYIIAIIGLIINTIIMTIFYEYLNFHYILSQLIATGLVLIWNFLGNLLWTFK